MKLLNIFLPLLFVAGFASAQVSLVNSRLDPPVNSGQGCSLGNGTNPHAVSGTWWTQHLTYSVRNDNDYQIVAVLDLTLDNVEQGSHTLSVLVGPNSTGTWSEDYNVSCSVYVPPGAQWHLRITSSDMSDAARAQQGQATQARINAVGRESDRLYSLVLQGQLSADGALSNLDSLDHSGIANWDDFRQRQWQRFESAAQQWSQRQGEEQRQSTQSYQPQNQQQTQQAAQQEARQQAYQEQLRQQQQAQQQAADAAKQKAIAEFQRKQAEQQKLAASYLNQAQQGQTNMTQFFLDQAQAYRDIDRKYEERQRAIDEAQAQEEAAQQAAAAQQAQQQQAAALAQQQAIEEHKRRMAPPRISTDDLPDFDQLLARSKAESWAGAKAPKTRVAQKEPAGTGNDDWDRMIRRRKPATDNGNGTERGYIGLNWKQTKDGKGVVVGWSPPAGSPAAEAGVQAGDVIASIDGQRASSVRQVSEALTAHHPGDFVKLELVRGRQTFVATIKVARRPAE